jgi:hypothetical protein
MGCQVDEAGADCRSAVSKSAPEVVLELDLFSVRIRGLAL